MRTITMTENHKNAYGFNTVLLATSEPQPVASYTLSNSSFSLPGNWIHMSISGIGLSAVSLQTFIRRYY